MTARSDRRKAELAVIEAARALVKYEELAGWFPRWQPLREAVEALDALPLNKADRVLSTNRAPETSDLAAASMERRAGSIAHRIFMAIRLAYMRGSTGLTADQVQQQTGLSHQSCSPRITQLRDEGWIEASWDRRETRSGREAVVWKPTVAGLYGLEGE